MIKKLNKKGFTLTELIVVIVIIGILAAVLIPSLTGYIDRAKNSAAQQEAGEVYRLYIAFQAEDLVNLPADEDKFAEYLLAYGGITATYGDDEAANKVLMFDSSNVAMAEPGDDTHFAGAVTMIFKANNGKFVQVNLANGTSKIVTGFTYVA